MATPDRCAEHQQIRHPFSMQPPWTTVPVSVYPIPESLLTRQLTAFTDMILQSLQTEADSVTYFCDGKAQICLQRANPFHSYGRHYSNDPHAIIHRALAGSFVKSDTTRIWDGLCNVSGCIRSNALERCTSEDYHNPICTLGDNWAILISFWSSAIYHMQADFGRWGKLSQICMLFFLYSILVKKWHIQQAKRSKSKIRYPLY